MHACSGSYNYFRLVGSNQICFQRHQRQVDNQNSHHTLQNMLAYVRYFRSIKQPINKCIISIPKATRPSDIDDNIYKKI